jgi:prolyl oligopeptidase
MPKLMAPLPHSPIEVVTDVLHGVTVPDPYRWLEDQDSARTRAWITEQTRYARSYLDSIPGRELIRERVCELLDVETYDSFLKSRGSYFFRKHLQGQEQPSIYFRDTAHGEDQLLVDAASRGTGPYTAVKPLRVSPNGVLLLYEVKQGGERTGAFEILDITSRRILPDRLPHGYLRGFSFAPDSRSFYYVHEATAAKRPFYRAVHHHVLGASFAEDQEIFCAGEDQKLRIGLISGQTNFALLVTRFLDKTYTDFYLYEMSSGANPVQVLRKADYGFRPRLLAGRILALTDRRAPNRRVVEVPATKGLDPLFVTLVPETDALIHDWLLTANYILVSYSRGSRTHIEVFDSFGKRQGEIPCGEYETHRLVAGSVDDDDLLIEHQSFIAPAEIQHCSGALGTGVSWAQGMSPIDSSAYAQTSVSFRARNGINIPMFVVGRRDVLEKTDRPTIMTSYGGYGVSMAPQFSTFAALLMELGCLFAVPNIRGGSEFGADWHKAAKRRNRQNAYADFLCAAEWLIQTGRTSPQKLAIFGGSNGGLLVGAALTQRPDLFRAAMCMVPMLDMLRYHLFDNSHVWMEEFGTADNPDDFAALAKYSPYHHVRSGASYPATMIVSGDSDQNCNPLHSRKMTARLQAANTSEYPIFLDYSKFRGHSPVLPLHQRINALTDRIAFLSDQLQLPV